MSVERKPPFKPRTSRRDGLNDIPPEVSEWLRANRPKARAGDPRTILQIYASAIELISELENCARSEEAKETTQDLAENRLWWPVTISNSHRVGFAPGSEELQYLVESLQLGSAININKQTRGVAEGFHVEVQILFNKIVEHKTGQAPRRNGLSRDKWKSTDTAKHWRNLLEEELKEIPGDNWCELMLQMYPDLKKSADDEFNRKQRISEPTMRNYQSFVLDKALSYLHGLLKD